MLNLVSLLGTIQNLLEKNNTTTSSFDISANLNKRIVSFHKGVEGMSEKLPIPNHLYPACFVELSSKTEDFADLGRRPKREAFIGFDIVLVTHYGIGSDRTSVSNRETAGLENLQGTQNIEYLLREKIHLSTTSSDTDNYVLQNLLPDTDYSTSYNEDTYNVVSKITNRSKILTS
jgi:hypothetical protein